MSKIWVVDNEPSQKYPIYTRGNVGEVFPEAVAPLTWTTFGAPSADPGWRDAFVRFGAFDMDEFDPNQIDILSVFGGYCYINVSISRVFAVRTPGLTPDLMDQTLFGTSEAPPYSPLPTDESPEHEARVGATLQWVFTVDDLPELAEDQRVVQALVDRRPDFSKVEDRALWEGLKAELPEFRRLFGQHIFITYCATVPVGVINGVCAAIGQPELAMRVLTGIGGVDSAAPSWAMWELGRQVGASSDLTALFDAGVDGLIERLRADTGGDVTKFVQGFDEFVDQFGSRGPNEWEMRSPTWGTDHHLALAAIDRMRKAPESAAPQRHWDSYAAEREQLTKVVGEQLAGDPEVQGQFLAAVRAAGIFLAGRERSKTTVIRWLHEMRLRARELGRRMAERGVFDDLLDFGMLTKGEWDQLIDDPSSFDRSVMAERYELFRKLQTLEPPFIINGEIPPLDQWMVRGATPVQEAGSGEVLTGIAGCPGTHTGRARVVLDPDDPRDLEPGDVLIAPITDPSWTPLFVPAGAVVVDVGAQISHAVIVSRELGIPCVVSIHEGTRKIPDGATVTVDGTAGTVTVH